LDGFAYGLNSTISLTSELEPLTKKLINELDSEVFYEYWPGPSTGLDQWNFIREGVPSVSINPNMDQYMKIYHSARDTPELLSEELMKRGLKLTLSLVLKLDSDPVLPYDFSSTAKKIIKDLSEKTTKIDDTIGLKKLIENTTNLKVVSEIFNKKLNTLKQKELDREAISLINNVQRKICSALIPKLTDRKCGISLRSAQTLPAYLDALINIKKAILAAKQNDKETCMTSLKTLTNNLWGLDFNPEIYEGWKDKVLASRRAQGLKFDLMPEARGLDEKFKKGIEDKNDEISSLEEKYKIISRQISDKLSELNLDITEASSSLTEIMYKLH
jgi:hypothetical protein